MERWIQFFDTKLAVSHTEYSDVDDKNWCKAADVILGFQNEEHDYAIKMGLCDDSYTPGTFTIGEISENSKFLECPVSFRKWMSGAISDEIELITEYYPHFYDSEVSQSIIPEIIAALEHNPGRCPPLKTRIWYQEYPDIVRRLILSRTINNPEQELDIYPHLKNQRSGLIFEVLDYLDEQHLSLSDWLHISISAGILGVDEKTVHAATSAIDTRMAISLPPSSNYARADIERVSHELLRTANSKCRIDATSTFFDIMELNQSKDFNLVCLTDDYLETIVLLKYYQKLLEKYPKLIIYCVAKSLACGNDATYHDVKEFLQKMPDLKTSERFFLVPNGPVLGGCNLLKMDKNVLDLINKSHLLDVRGARNFEMIQGINKETFFGFMVCREISESVTGLLAERLPLVYIHQPAGKKPFDGFRDRYKRIENGKMIALKSVKDNRELWE